MSVGQIARVASSILLIAGIELATTGCEESFPEPFETDRGAYSEFVDYAELHADLAALNAQTTALYLAIPQDKLGDGDLEALLLACRRRAIPVRAWLLLDDADGYWPGEDNLPAFEAVVDEFWRWNRDADLGVEWILVDMEPPLSISNQLAEALEAGSFADVLPVLLDNRGAQEHAAARQAWADAVDDWHARGINVAVVALPYVLDDFGDDDADIQDMFESPIEGIDWDEVGFLVYQNLYTATDGSRLGPALVHSYTLTAKERFGDRAAIALGTIGSIGKNTTSVGYETVEQLRTDIAAAYAGGVDRIHLFSIDGMREQGGTDAWLSDLDVDPVAPDPSSDVDRNRDAIAVLDQL